MSKLRYKHDFINMSKPMHSAFLELLLIEFLGKGGKVKKF